MSYSQYLDFNNEWEKQVMAGRRAYRYSGVIIPGELTEGRLSRFGGMSPFV